MTHVEKELLYIPGQTHVKELLEAEDGYCYISNCAESLQTEYFAQLLSRRNADGNLKATAV
eukprot:1545045-Pleurochrysis_carterae.AAC.1